MKHTKIISTLIVLIVISALFTSCNKKEETPITKENYLLGTIVQLSVYGENADSACNEAMKRISEIDDKMSATKKSSEISNINKNAGVNYVKVSSDTFDVIKKAIKYSEISNGAFDISVGPLVNLWGIGTEHAKLPSIDEIKTKISLINYKDILLDEKNLSVKLKRKNQSIDLGAIAKGFTADEVKSILKKHNIYKAFINLGGNVVAVGSKDGKGGNTPWTVGIQDPLLPRGEYFGIVKIKDKSIVSSGNYERYFEKDGKRYHHILDTKTGYPAEKGLISTTIVSDKSIDGDSLSTTSYILGLDKAEKLIESINGVEAIFVTKDKKVYTTSGLKDDFELTNKDFEYKK